MFKQSLLLVTLVFFLSACAPKYNYLNPQVSEPKFDHILVVVDYLHVVDDVGELLDYPEEKNQQQIHQLRTVVQSVLAGKGFQGTIDFALVSSGLGLNPEQGFEHYRNGQLNEALLYPPFYIESPYHESFQYQLIGSFAEAQNIAFVPVSNKTTDYYADLRMNSLDFNAAEAYLTPQLNPAASVGVLHIRAVWPRVSFVKAMGVSLLTAGLTAGATSGAYVGIATPMGVPHSTAVLFDNQTGEVVWKNQVNGDVSQYGEQSRARFFKAFPELN